MAGERILIIGEDPDLVEFLLTHVLSTNGYLTQATTDGQAGLKAVQENRPDMVLLDLSPSEFNSTEILARLKVAGDPPVVGVARAGTEAEALHALRLGARDVLVRPIEAENAAAVIACVLHRERLETERERLVSELTRSNETLENALIETQALKEIGETLLSSLDLQHVLNASVQEATNLIKAQEGYLFLLAPERNEFFLRATRNLSDEHASSICVRVDDSIVHQVLRTDEPIALSSTGAPSIRLEFKSTAIQHDDLVQSLIFVPLHDQNQIMGVLGIANVTANSSFSEGDVKLLRALADWAAIAIRNARLYTRTDQTLSRVLEEVLAAQNKVDLILRRVSEGVFSINEDLRFTSANPAMERITGWQESELLGQRFDDILVPKVQGCRLYREQTVPGKALDTQTSIDSTEHTILRKDNQRIHVISTATPLRATDASIVGALGTMHVTTPEARSKHQSCEKKSETRQPQRTQVHRTAEIALRTLLSNTGSTLSDCHPITIRPIISQVVKCFEATNPDVSFQVKLTPDLPFAIGDESKIELALMNLIDNALALNDHEQPIRITTDANEDSVVVVVEGAGENAQPVQLYDPPYSEDDPISPNAHLGSLWATPQIKLYIADKLIQAQGGSVWTEYNAGRGACFYFSLPKIEVQDVAQALAD